MTDKQLDRLIRWEDKRRDQFSVANNLLLTLGIAAVGYLFDRVIAHKIPLSEVNSGLVMACISVTLGTLLSISRLLDFRYTAKKIRAEIDGSNEMACYQKCAKVFGIISWILFGGQALALMVSVILLCSNIASIVNHAAPSDV